MRIMILLKKIILYHFWKSHRDVQWILLGDPRIHSLNPDISSLTLRCKFQAQ